MAYCTLDDIKKMIPVESLLQLTDDEQTGAIIESRVDEAIAQADSEINGYIANRYTVPFVVVPDILRKFSVDISIYNLYARKVEQIPEARQTRYDNAIRMLRDVAAGKAALDGGTTPETTDNESNITSGARIFTRDKLEGF